MIDSILNTLQSAAGNILQLLTYDPKAPMLFSSGLFWVLFLIFLPIYAFLKGSKWKMVTFVVCFRYISIINRAAYFFNAHRHIACRLVVVAHNLQIEDSQCAPFIHVDFNLFFIVDIGIFQIFQLFPVELEPDGGRQLSAI